MRDSFWTDVPPKNKVFTIVRLDCLSLRSSRLIPCAVLPSTFVSG